MHTLSVIWFPVNTRGQMVSFYVGTLYINMADWTRQICVLDTTWISAGVSREMKIWSLRSKWHSHFQPRFLHLKNPFYPPRSCWTLAGFFVPPHKYSTMHYFCNTDFAAQGMSCPLQVVHIPEMFVWKAVNKKWLINNPEGYQTSCKHLVQWKPRLERKQWW